MVDKKNKKGAALIEYALLIVMLVLVAVGGAQFLGKAVCTKLSTVGRSIVQSYN